MTTEDDERAIATLAADHYTPAALKNRRYGEARRRHNARTARLVALARLGLEAEGMREALTRSEEAWTNAIDMGLIPPKHVMSATIIRDEARAALAPGRGKHP